MNLRELTKAGQIIKFENPGKWDDFSDVEVGRLALKHGIIHEPTAMVEYLPPEPTVTVVAKPIIPIPEPSFFFPGRQAQYHENQLKDFHAKANPSVAQINHGANVEMSIAATAHAALLSQERLAEEDQLRQSIHATEMVQNHAIREVTNFSLKKGLDVATYGLTKLEQEKQKLELEKAEKVSRISITEAKEKDENRLVGYREEPDW